MSTKDWILLLVPILCNGIVVFVLQKIFERKKLVSEAKHEYIKILQDMIDKALNQYVTAMQIIDDDDKQVEYLQSYICYYVDVYYYYQQNQQILKSLKSYMNKLKTFHEEIKEIQYKLGDSSYSLEDWIRMEALFCKIYGVLQNVQKRCVTYKI